MEIKINDKISYIKASNSPLCADIGIIRERDTCWLMDVGCGEECIAGLKDNYNVVISHFHQDHMSNIDKLRIDKLYGSRETLRHVKNSGSGETLKYAAKFSFEPILAEKDLYIGNLHIFLLPSSHAKGCLGLEIDEEYAFVGDALYGRVKDGCYSYNAQLLFEEINVLKSIKAEKLLVSHYEGLVCDKARVIRELEKIYEKREKNKPEIIWNR